MKPTAPRRTALLAAFFVAGLAVALPPASAQDEKPRFDLDRATSILKGRVAIDGRAPRPDPVDVSRYPECAAAYPDGYRPVLVTGGGRVPNVLVHLEANRGGFNPSAWSYGHTQAARKDAKFEHRNCVIAPRMVAFMRGQDLTLVNQDRCEHEIEVLSMRTGVEPFTLRWQDSRILSNLLPKPEVGIKVSCKRHPWETAYIAGFDHPFFCVTDAEGNFELPPVQPGRYTIVAWWHPHAGRDRPTTVRVDAEIGPEQTIEAELVLQGH